MGEAIKFRSPLPYYTVDFTRQNVEERTLSPNLEAQDKVADFVFMGFEILADDATKEVFERRFHRQ